MHAETVSASAPGVHPTAVVDPEARLAPGVVLGPYVVVEADVEIGSGTEVLAGSLIHTGARIGARCRIGPYAVVAGHPGDSHFAGEPSLAILEDDVTLREFVTVHRATGMGAETRIGTGSLVMSYAHVGHNARVGERVVLTNGVQLGGHTRIGEYAVVGAATLVHQNCRVGEYAILGAASAANMDTLPFSMARGNTAKHYGTNRVGLRRHDIVGARYAAIEQALRAFRRHDRARLEALAEASPDVRRLLEFASASTRGVARFAGRG